MMGKVSDNQDSGNFRTALNGFNKADVLDYIDAIQSRRSIDLELKNQQVAELQNSLSAQETTVDELKKQLELDENELVELRDENAFLKQTGSDTTRLQSDFNRLAQEADILRLEKQDLQARLLGLQNKLSSVDELQKRVQDLTEQNDYLCATQEDCSSRDQESSQVISDLRNEKEALTAQLTKAEQHNASLRETGRRYYSFIGDVGSFIMELHSMGQRFLETSYKRSESCLQSIEDSVTTLSKQLTDTRTHVDTARQQLTERGTLAGLRLDELVQSLEESAGACGISGTANKNGDVHDKENEQER